MADREMPSVPDHDRRMAAARRCAGRYLGDRSWANLIVNAYLDPAMAAAALRCQDAASSTEGRPDA